MSLIVSNCQVVNNYYFIRIVMDFRVDNNIIGLAGSDDKQG